MGKILNTILAGALALGIGSCAATQEQRKENVTTIVEGEIMCPQYQKGMTAWGFFDNESYVRCFAVKGKNENLFGPDEKVKLTLGELLPEVNLCIKIGHIDGTETKEKIDCYRLLDYERL